MINVRKSLYETNSSSVHSLVVFNSVDWEDFQKGLCAYSLKEGRCISRKQLECRFRDYLGKLKVNDPQEEGMISRWVKNEKYFVMIGQWPWDSLLREFEEIGDLEYKQDGLVVVELRGFDG